VGICNCHLGQRTQSKSTLRAIIPDGFCLESFRASYSFSTAKKSNQKMPLATKVLNRTKRLILGSFRMCPFNLHSNDFPVICPKNKPFLAETLKAETAVAEPPKRVSAMPICHVFLRWVSSLFACESWQHFYIPEGTEIDPRLKLTGPEYNDYFKADHYQIEVDKQLRIDSYKGALDNLARAAIKKAYEDARK
jgi:hypothetical protein